MLITSSTLVLCLFFAVLSLSAYVATSGASSESESNSESEMDMVGLKSFFDGLREPRKNALKTCREESTVTEGCWDFEMETDGTFVNKPCPNQGLFNESDYCFNDNEFASPWQGICCTEGRVTQIFFIQSGLEGTISSGIGKLSLLKGLDLSTNKIEGSLPTTIGNLLDLMTLNFFSNSLSGCLPLQLGELINLEYLSLRNNLLTGSLPAGIGNLEALTYLDVSSNRIGGSLPSQLGIRLTSIDSLDISSNELTGTLPSSIVHLRQMTSFNASNNQLQGTLPSGIGNIEALTYLSLSYNKFSGTLSDLSNSNITKLDLRNNTLSGAIGGNLPKSLEEVFLSHNEFTFVNLTIFQHVYKLDISWNNFSQSLDLSNFAKSVDPLTEIALLFNDNKFAGRLSLDSASPKLKKSLGILRLQGNAFTGPIPAGLGEFSGLLVLDLSRNAITSTLPSTLGKLSNLKVLDLSYNAGLVGPVSANLLQGWSHLVSLSLSSCDFSGPFSSVGANLENLRIDNNRFTSVYPPQHSAKLNHVDFSSNKIKGKISGGWFVPTLEIFIASGNCIQGPLPVEICNATELNTIIMNGLSMRCSQPFTFFGRAVAQLKRFDGSIPGCLFGLTSIGTIQFAENGFRGEIIAPAVSPTLRSLTLSNNKLTGPIPSAILTQASQLVALSLGFNRLDGSLNGMSRPRSGSQINLAVNRLSGSIPSALLAVQSPNATLSIDDGSRQTQSLQVLEGNMFDCNPLRKNQEVPRNDPYVSKFQCGSSSFDGYFYAFLVISVIAPSIICTSRGRFRFLPVFAPHTPITDVSGLSDSLKSIHTTTAAQNIVVRDFLRLLLRIRFFCICICWSFMMILIPIFAVTNVFYGTQEQTYIYTLSAAFKGGVAPAALYLFTWTAILLITQVFISLFLGHDLRFQPSRDSLSPDGASYDASISQIEKGTSPGRNESPKLKGNDMIRLLFIFFFNMGAMVGLNFLYVFYTTSADVLGQILAKIVFSGFKFLYSSIFLPWLIKHDSLANFMGSKEVRFKGRNSFEFVLQVINTLLIPSIVTAFQASTCFAPLNPLISQIPAVTVAYQMRESRYIYQYQAITSNTGDIQFRNQFVKETELVQRSSTFQPLFSYSYQCTSTLIVFYAPIFLLVSLFSIMGILFENLIATLLKSDCLPPWLESLVFLITPKLLAGYKKRRAARIKAENKHKSQSKSTRDKAAKKSFSILEMDQFFFNFSTDMIVVASFGLVCPLLAFSSSLSMYVRAMRKHRLVVSFLDENRQLIASAKAMLQTSSPVEENGSEGRLPTNNSKSALSLEPALDLHDLESELESFIGELSTFTRQGELRPTPTYKIHMTIFLFSCLFVAFFLYDIAADKQGGAAGSWAPVSMSLVPAGILLLSRIIPDAWSSAFVLSCQKLAFGEVTDVEQQRRHSLSSRLRFSSGHSSSAVLSPILPTQPQSQSQRGGCSSTRAIELSSMQSHVSWNGSDRARARQLSFRNEETIPRNSFDRMQSFAMQLHLQPYANPLAVISRSSQSGINGQSPLVINHAPISKLQLHPIPEPLLHQPVPPQQPLKLPPSREARPI